MEIVLAKIYGDYLTQIIGNKRSPYLSESNSNFIRLFVTLVRMNPLARLVAILSNLLEHLTTNCLLDHVFYSLNLFQRSFISLDLGFLSSLVALLKKLINQRGSWTSFCKWKMIQLYCVHCFSVWSISAVALSVCILSFRRILIFYLQFIQGRFIDFNLILLLLLSYEFIILICSQ